LSFTAAFWVNLHQTLYNQAAGKKAGRTPNLSALNPAETTAWNEALDYYERNLAEHDLLVFSMIKINGALAVVGDAVSLNASGVPKPVVEMLEKAAPVYRAHWWTEHNRKNHEWIDQISAGMGCSRQSWHTIGTAVLWNSEILMVFGETIWRKPSRHGPA
jgi:hypothetical protein